MVLPLDYGIAVTEQMGGGILIIIAISEQGIYGVIYSGWASNSKYPFLGSLRSTSQMISYSVAQSLIIQTIIFTLGSVDFHDILIGQHSMPLVLPLLPMAFLFLISAIAETNRAPMDLPEAESELVSGFMTEYSGMSFTFFFQGEYTNIQVICTLFFIFFFGISNSLLLVFIMIWVRASQARQRYDQQQTQGWSYFLPFTIGYITFLPPFLFIMN